MKVSSLGKLIVLVIGIAISSVAFAAMDREAHLAELENQMQQVRTETAMDTYGANTALARPMVEDGCDWFITVDVLYWETKIGGTEYAYGDQDPVASLPIKGRTKHMEFHWDWGVRAGLGCNFQHDGWDIRGQYTWFNTSGSDSTSAGLNSSVVPLRGSSEIAGTQPLPGGGFIQNSFIFCKSAKSQYDFDYQAIDVELGRDYFVSADLSFRPYWGVKTAWIDLQQNTRYTGGQPTGSNDQTLGLNEHTVHIREDSDFWGIGPRTGVGTRWHLGEGISFFGNISGALVYGYFDVDHKERFTLGNDFRIRLNADRHAFSPTVQYQIGLCWDSYFHNNRHHLMIGVGFEGQYWWRMNQMLKIDNATSLKYERYSEDLSMYGVTINAKFEF